MHDGQSLPSVDALTDSDSPAPIRKAQVHKTGGKRKQGLHVAAHSGALPPIRGDDLSEASSSHASELKELGIPVKRKRGKPSGASWKERLVSKPMVRAFLARKCRGCRKHCMAKFLRNEKFSAVMGFRLLWRDMHKLDQDRLVPCQCFATFYDSRYSC